MVKRFFVLILILAIVSVGGVVWLRSKTEAPFASLTVEEMHKRIVEERDFAIAKAKEEGNYKCCIEPPCTMCFMEANQWNNQTPGTCACDDLIAKGKEPCPQCQHGLCQSTESSTCEVN